MSSEEIRCCAADDATSCLSSASSLSHLSIGLTDNHDMPLRVCHVCSDMTFVDRCRSETGRHPLAGVDATHQFAIDNSSPLQLAQHDSEASPAEVPSQQLSTGLEASASSSMKRFTNPHGLTSILHKTLFPRRYMQAQQSLFQSAFKDPNQRVAHGVKKSIPFLNLWAPSADVQRQQEQKRQLNMASATSFYDFKPLDSTSLSSSFLPPLPLPHHQLPRFNPPIQPQASLNHQSLTTTLHTEKGTAVPLETYKGKVVLIVNTASKCGFTPQYQGLEALYKKIQASNPDQFVILGFPCNQFGGQEPVRPLPLPQSLFQLGIHGGKPPNPCPRCARFPPFFPISF